MCLAGFANVSELLFCTAMQSVKALSKQGFMFVGVKGMPFLEKTLARISEVHRG
jgi:hypothetical protein